MLGMFGLAALIVFGSPANPVRKADTPAPETLLVYDAEYGDAGTDRLCDATRVIAALCNGQGRCTIPVSNSLCGDPAFGTPKKLHMAFKCVGSAPQLLVAAEPGTLRIGCKGAAEQKRI